MLPGFEVVPADRPGGSFNGAPWRIVLHTTEGGTAAGAIGAYRTHGGWPHFTVDPQRGTRMQHYELNVSSRALLHRPTDPETNRAGAVNIEIVGFATAAPTWPKAWLTWLGAAVLLPIRAVCPFSLVAPDFVAYPASYGFGAAQRLTWDSWGKFSGVLGHEHAPGNDHGDPGAIDITTVIAAIGHTDPPPTKRYRVNAITAEQIFDLHDDGIVYARNIKTGSPIYNLGAIPPATGKAVSLDADTRPDGTIDVSVKTDKGVILVNGAPKDKPFQGWYVPG